MLYVTYEITERVLEVAVESYAPVNCTLAICIANLSPFNQVRSMS